jgi:hypothetical protein
MTELLQRAINELRKLPDYRQDKYAALILERLAEEDMEDEATWDARVVTEALGDALNPDGSIDFDKLEAQTETVTLEELFPEENTDDEP